MPRNGRGYGSTTPLSIAPTAGSLEPNTAATSTSASASASASTNMAAAARIALLKYLRVSVCSVPQNVNFSPLSSLGSLLRRHFSEDVRGSFLDKSEVTDRVISVVKNFQKVDPSKVTPNAHFQNDLGLDSLDAVEIVMALEEEFGFEIPDNEADKINSIDLAVDFISSHPQAK